MQDINMQHILVPVDGSEPAKRALERAVYIARNCHSELTVLYVVDMNKEISSWEQVSTGGYIPGELKEKGYQILLDMMREIPKEIPAEAVVRIGDPAKEIVAYTEEHEFGLIVIGNRGFSQLKQIVLGSVSQYVLLRVTIPTLIVR